MENEKKFFQKYQVKDIVFLAIISAVILITSAVMPLVAHVPLFGIIQIVLGIQFSLFPAVGVFKVRKPGSLLIMSVCSGVVLVFMNPIMFACLTICALLSEIITLLFFKSYRRDLACWLVSALYLPLSLPFLYVWYQIIGGEETVAAYANRSPVLAVVLSFSAILLCGLGAFLGVIISREMKKSGVLKK